MGALLWLWMAEHNMYFPGEEIYAQLLVGSRGLAKALPSIRFKLSS